MKTILVSFALVLFFFQATAQEPLPFFYSGTPTINYVRTWDAIAPETNESNITVATGVDKFKMGTQYMDGLGRPLQSVIKQGSLTTGSSATAVDFVSSIRYDQFGRETFKYLSFPANNINNSNGSLDDGMFKINPFNQQEQFYKSTNITVNPIAGQGESYFYSLTNFENSPLGRNLESYAVGNSWAGSSGQTLEADRKSVKNKFYFNTTIDAVRIWNVTDIPGSFGTYASNGAYAENELYKNIAVDENNKQIIEFTDKSGKTLLKKVQLTATSDNGAGTNHDNWLCTYYIYDERGNLRCVVQPLGVGLISTNWDLSNAIILDQQCFRYEYDSRNRMITKKVPGAAVVEMVYDVRDRQIMVQDGNMLNIKWQVTKYDLLNRPVESGLWSNTGTASAHRSAAANAIDYPSTVSNYELLTKSHFDDYAGIPGGLTANFNNSWSGNFNTSFNTAPLYAQAQTASTATRGMITWTQVKILDATNTYTYSLNIYDDMGRIIQVKSTNITGAEDVATTQYNWAGQPLIIVQSQAVNGINAQTTTIITKLNYDLLGRLIKTEKIVGNTLVNNGAMPAYKTISQLSYDALGQLKTKELGTKPGLSTPLAQLQYEYNIRGWLLSVNKSYISAGTNNDQYFGMELGYDKNSSYSSYSPQYNGNISGTIWKSEGDQQKRKYDFSYDAVNRLTAAGFNQYVSGTGTTATFDKSANIDFSVSNLSYDANGNIMTMDQKGLKLNSSPLIDQLVYAYQDKSNKLVRVTDLQTDPNTRLGDFKDGSNGATDDYNYDANGNLNIDNNKAISSITYNHLNLPSMITVTGKGTITYTYDATGNKLKKTTVDNTVVPTKTTITDYISGNLYENNILQQITQEEGRIRFKPLSGSIPASLQYDYMIKDHLGNVRMVLTEEQETRIYPAATLEGTYSASGTQVNSMINHEKSFFNIDYTKVAPETGILSWGSETTANTKLYYNHNGNPPGNVNYPAGCSPVQTDGSNKLYRLNATTNKTGLEFMIKVMAGDKIDIFGKSYYLNTGTVNNSNSTTLDLLGLMTSMLGAPANAASEKGLTGTTLNSINSNLVPNTFFTGSNGETTTTPKAYINYILFDEQFKFVGGSASRVGSSGLVKDHWQTDAQLQNIPVIKNGYIFVYVSNESNLDVFFDNLQVIHKPGPILEETHYYPFGLTMSGISSKAAGKTENKYRYSGKELQSKEFSDASCLELYDFHARMQDPQLGRFWQIDPKCEIFSHYNPYNYCFNNPMLFVDPDGMLAKYNWDDGKYYDEGKEVSWDNVQQQHQIGDYATSTSVMVAPELEGDGKTVKNDYGTGALTSIVNAAIKTGGNIKVLHVKNADDAASQIEGITAKISNLFFLSHGDAKNSPHRAYFAIGSQNFHTEDIGNSNALSRIAARLASTPGPLPSAASVIIFACGAGGIHNGGAEMLRALAKKFHATVYGPQGFGVGGSSIFSSKAGSQGGIVTGHDPNSFSNALKNHGNWTRAYEFGASQINQTVKNVYFDAFGRIHYSQ